MKRTIFSLFVILLSMQVFAMGHKVAWARVAQPLTDSVRAEFTLHATPNMRALPQRRAEAASGHLFYEDFESVTNQPPYDLPVGWTRSATPDYPEDNWLGATIGAGDRPLPGISGYKYAVILQTGHNYESDAWMYSPAIRLEAGKTYDIIFYTYIPYNPNSASASELKVNIGIEPTPESMTEELYSSNGSQQYDWTAVRRSFTPKTSSTYYIGFHSTSPASSYITAVDNVIVDEAQPFYVGPGLINAGTVKNVQKVHSSFTVSNIGSLPLTVTSADCPKGVTLDNLPVTIGTAEDGNYAHDINFTLDASQLKLGADTLRIELHTNDTYHENPVVPIAVNVIDTRITDYWVEHFDDGKPEQWDLGNWAVYANGGIDHSNALEAWAITESTVTTHSVNAGSHPQVSLWYKVLKYNTSKAMEASKVKLHFLVSRDNGDTFEEVYSILPSGGNMSHTPSTEYTKVSFTLPADYADKTCLFRITADADYDFFNCPEYFIDDLALGTPKNVDLEASSLRGTGFPERGTDNEYTVRITNHAVNPATNYKVQLVNALTHEVLNETEGPSISPDSMITVSLKLTPAAEGPMTIIGRVSISNDENEANDAATPLQVSVVNATTTPINIGGQVTSGTSYNGLPLGFYYEHYVSQSVYQANEIGLVSGSIKGLQYYTTSKSDMEQGNIQIYVGETTREDFSDGKWTDVKGLTKVFEGVMPIYAGNNAVDIPFTNPYAYKGGNLVVCTVRNRDNFVMGTLFAVDKGHPNASMFYKSNEDIDINHLPDNSEIVEYIPIVSFYTDKGKTGKLTGRVLDDKGHGIEHAVVSIDGTMISTTTNFDGAYTFPEIAEGQYAVIASSYGYYDATEQVSVTYNNVTTRHFTLFDLPRYTITGTVRNTDGANLEGALVKLKGYDNYYAAVGSDGYYTLQDVYGGNGKAYTLEVSAPYYLTGKIILSEVGDNMTRDITLREAPSSVTAVEAIATDEQATVKWTQPEYQFRYDDGVVNDQIGYNNLGAKAVIGTVYRRGGKISKIQWYLTSQDGPHPSVNLLVFKLSSSGEPTDTLLAAYGSVPNADMQWNTFQLPTPLEVPNGFFLAASTNSGFMALGKTDVSQDYPYEPHLHYASTDFSKGPDQTGVPRYTDITDAYDKPYHLALRAVGEDYGAVDYDFHYSTDVAKAAALRPHPAYTVLRRAVGEDDYTLLSEGIEGTTYTDPGFAQVSEGRYKYAVTADYGASISEPVLSNTVVKGMKVTIHLHAGYDQLPAQAAIRLTNNDDMADYSTYVFNASTATSYASISGVDNGSYRVSVVVPGFEEYADTFVVRDDRRDFDVILHEIMAMPRSLTAELVEPVGDVVLRWKQGALFDNFEQYADFQVSDIGDYRQQTIAKSQVKGISEVDFANEYAATPWMVFCPYQTRPAMPTIHYYRYTSEPYSGQKYLCAHAQVDNADSWFILPAFSVQEGDELSFYAKSIVPTMAASAFEVGVYGLDGSSDFTLLPDSHREAANQWTLYRFDLSDYSGKEIRLALHDVQVGGAFMLMIDDLYLGKASLRGANAASDGYNIYVDGERVASHVEGYTFTLSQLPQGTHQVGVSAAYGDHESETLYVTVQDISDGISTNLSGDASEDRIFRLDGTRVDESKPLRHGVYISNRKKVVVK